MKASSYFSRVYLHFFFKLQVHNFLHSHRRALHVLLHNSFLMLLELLGCFRLRGQILHLLLVNHDGEGVMRRVDILICTGVALAATVQVEVGDLFCQQVDVFYIYTEALELLHFGYLVTFCEEFYEPAVDETAWLIAFVIWKLSLEIKVVPELEMRISLEGLGELLKDWLKTADVLLEGAVHIELLQAGQFQFQVLPIFEGARHMDIDDTAAASLTCVVEVFLAGVHHQGSREHSLEQPCSAEVAFQLFNYSFHRILFDLLDDPLHERNPILQISISLNYKLLLARMRHEGSSELLRVIVYVFGEPQHDYHPNLIRLQFQVAVFHVGLVKSCEKSIAAAVAERGIFHVGVDMGILSLFPEVRALGIPIGFICLSSLQILNRDGFESWIHFFEFGLFGLLVFFLCEFCPDVVEERHQLIEQNEWKNNNIFTFILNF